MELKGQHILVISPDPWEGLQLSKHDVARALVARGNTVCFWPPPVASAPRMRLEGEGPLRIVRYRHWLRGANKLPRSLHLRYYERLIARIGSLSGRAFDVIWSFDVTRLQWFPTHPAKKVLHLADHDMLETHAGEGLVRTSDLVLTVTQPLREEVLRMMPEANVHNIGHMVEDRWFSSVPQRDATRPHPTDVAYAGQLKTDYVDWGTLHATISKHPDLTFHFYGSHDLDYPAEGMRATLTLPNVVVHGLVDRTTLIPALRKADILILCYRADELQHIVANSHKLLEYLSTGNPIVCSHTGEFATRTDILQMANDRSGFLDRFEATVRDYPRWNAPDLREQRVALAKERSAGAMLDRIALLLHETRNPARP